MLLTKFEEVAGLRGLTLHATKPQSFALLLAIRNVKHTLLFLSKETQSFHDRQRLKVPNYFYCAEPCYCSLFNVAIEIVYNQTVESMRNWSLPGA